MRALTCASRGRYRHPISDKLKAQMAQLRKQSNDAIAYASSGVMQSRL